jgi:hypothetical protein
MNKLIKISAVLALTVVASISSASASNVSVTCDYTYNFSTFKNNTSLSGKITGPNGQSWRMGSFAKVGPLSAARYGVGKYEAILYGPSGAAIKISPYCNHLTLR